MQPPKVATRPPPTQPTISLEKVTPVRNRCEDLIPCASFGGHVTGQENKPIRRTGSTRRACQVPPCEPPSAGAIASEIVKAYPLFVTNASRLPA